MMLKQPSCYVFKTNLQNKRSPTGCMSVIPDSIMQSITFVSFLLLTILATAFTAPRSSRRSQQESKIDTQEAELERKKSKCVMDPACSAMQKAFMTSRDRNPQELRRKYFACVADCKRRVQMDAKKERKHKNQQAKEVKPAA
ncbi:hypothetical protein M514_10700 [Trichuris suis]|uniref:Uncharacterized protein n=1 Tax=Trichuris suis TaxID=68888 RepID=A0A085MYY6_9BILA|nr:hypothetical protein M514_10700 [Trichuris suis]